MHVAVEHGVIAEDDQQFRTRQKFPAIARRKLHVLADIVVLDLGEELHVWGEVQRKIQGADMNRYMTGGQMNDLQRVVSDDRDQFIGKNRYGGIRLQHLSVIEPTALHIENTGDAPF